MPSLEPLMAFPSVDALTSARTSRITLKSRTIDLWGCTLEASATALVCCRHWLSGEERVRAGRFVRPEDQTGFALAHGVLRFVLARYVGVDPAALRFENGPTGKPALTRQDRSGVDVRFNLSHSHGRMLIAAAQGQDVGVDLEEVRDNVEPLKLAERFYTTAEYDRIKHRPVSDHAWHFYRLWVAKEAVLKGQGIGIPSLQECEIVSSPVSPRAAARLPPGSALQPGWTVQWLRCGPAWQGAVSAFGDEWSVQVLDGDV
ncbi:MAG TPA: 4'-phosphopantetheinyl transferase superfamily protein [Nitrospira sp.]|nr:4'-phosphopantetheinyl transferase superfamily protein [Nitrospira sp.]